MARTIVNLSGIALLVPLLLVGCDSDTRCALRGCAAPPVEIELVAPDGGYLATLIDGDTQREHLCDLTVEGGEVSASGLLCATASTPTAFGFYEIESSSVTIRIEGSGLSTEVAAPLEYDVSFPNGRECAPRCIASRLSITLE